MLVLKAYAPVTQTCFFAFTVCSCSGWGVVQTLTIRRGNILLLHPVFHGEYFHIHPTHTPLSGISFRTERLISQRYSAGTFFIFKGKSSGQICGRPSKCHFGRINAHDAGMPCVDIFACCFAFVCVFYYLLRETDSLFSFAKRFHLALFLIFKKAWCVLFHHYLTQLYVFLSFAVHGQLKAGLERLSELAEQD